MSVDPRVQEVPNHWKEANEERVIDIMTEAGFAATHLGAVRWSDLNDGEREFYRTPIRAALAALLAVPARQTVCPNGCDDGKLHLAKYQETDCHVCGGLGFIDSESIGEVLALAVQTEHFVDVTEEGWGIQHPLACRPALLDCEIHKAVNMQAEMFGRILALGRSVVTLDRRGEPIYTPVSKDTD